jgi:hypothetical protein
VKVEPSPLGQPSSVGVGVGVLGAAEEAGTANTDDALDEDEEESDDDEEDETDDDEELEAELALEDDRDDDTELEEEELDEEAEEAIVGVAATTLIPPTLFVLYAVTNEAVDTNLR